MPVELIEARRIAVALGLLIEDFEGYPPSFECYLIEQRIRQHLARLRDEIREHENAMIRNAVLAAA